MKRLRKALDRIPRIARIGIDLLLAAATVRPGERKQPSAGRRKPQWSGRPSCWTG